MRLKVLIAALCLGVATGCVTPHGSVAEDVDGSTWYRSVELHHANSDTVALRNMSIYLRTNDRFRQDSLTVEVVMHSPDSLRYGEYYTLALPSRQHPASLRREIELPYRHDVRLRCEGDYTITIRPVRPVRGVEAVGINFTK